MVILKIDKGTTSKLLEKKILKEDESKNLTGEELTLELKDRDVVIQAFREGIHSHMEIADVNGSFTLGIELSKDKLEKLRHIVRRLGP